MFDSDAVRKLSTRIQSNRYSLAIHLPFGYLALLSLSMTPDSKGNLL